MRFYTNVQMVGDHFLVRGYENGKHFMTREKFNPTLFVPSQKKTKYQTLNGEYVEAVQPGSVRDCREFIKRYDGVENFKIYGNTYYIYQYISENYPEEELKFDTSKIKITTLDIEVASENGFPDVESAAEEVLLITIQDYSSKQIRTWGMGPFKNQQKNVIYRSFDNERDLLMDFINWWMVEENTPEVVTGWNIELYDIPYLVISIYILSQFLVATFNILFKFHLTDLIKERNNALSSFLSSREYTFNQRTHIKIDRVSI